MTKRKKKITKKQAESILKKAKKLAATCSLNELFARLGKAVFNAKKKSKKSRK